MKKFGSRLIGAVLIFFGMPLLLLGFLFYWAYALWLVGMEIGSDVHEWVKDNG